MRWTNFKSWTSFVELFTNIKKVLIENKDELFVYIVNDLMNKQIKEDNFHSN